MTSPQGRDHALARQIAMWIQRFPEAWQLYQDWLGEIVSSWDKLQADYGPWQSRFIYRWRLVYFLVYVLWDILMNWIQSKLRSPQAGLGPFSFSSSFNVRSRLKALPNLFEQKINLHNYCRILQRWATLLAVSELTLCGIAAITGILIALYYQPIAVGAHQSLTMIANEVNSGTLVLSLHHLAGNGLIAIALLQIVVMYLGREFLWPWFVGWISGILLTLTAIALSWTAIILTWEQVGFWRFKIELDIIRSIPVLGSGLSHLISGGEGISTLTLQRLYTIHSYVLAIAALLLSVIHLGALMLQERSRAFSLSQSVEASQGTEPSHCHGE